MVRYLRLEHLHELPGLIAHVPIPPFQGFTLSFVIWSFKWITKIEQILLNLLSIKTVLQQIFSWIICVIWAQSSVYLKCAHVWQIVDTVLELRNYRLIMVDWGSRPYFGLDNPLYEKPLIHIGKLSEHYLVLFCCFQSFLSGLGLWEGRDLF